MSAIDSNSFGIGGITLEDADRAETTWRQQQLDALDSGDIDWFLRQALVRRSDLHALVAIAILLKGKK